MIQPLQLAMLLDNCVDCVHARCRLSSSIRIADIGCASGYMTTLFASLALSLADDTGRACDIRVIGVDHVPALVARARRILNERYDKHEACVATFAGDRVIIPIQQLQCAMRSPTSWTRHSQFRTAL